jgi:hypothetical protein
MEIAMHILIVGDKADIIASDLKSTWRDYTDGVETKPDTRAALKALKGNAPDALFVFDKLRDGSGNDLADNIRGMKGGENTHIVLVYAAETQLTGKKIFGRDHRNLPTVISENAAVSIPDPKALPEVGDSINYVLAMPYPTCELSDLFLDLLHDWECLGLPPRPLRREAQGAFYKRIFDGSLGLR